MMNHSAQALAALLRQQEAVSALRLQHQQQQQQRAFLLNGFAPSLYHPFPSRDVFMFMARMGSDSTLKAQLSLGSSDEDSPRKFPSPTELLVSPIGSATASLAGSVNTSPSDQKLSPPSSHASLQGVASLSSSPAREDVATLSQVPSPARSESPPIPPGLGKKKDKKWLASYENLRLYREQHGDCMVPRGFPANPHLASWVAEQRKQYKLFQTGRPSSINPERIQLLTQLGFAWNAQEAAWAKHMSDLTKYRAEYGDCVVPLNHHKYPKLGLWVKEQRRHGTLLKQGKHSHMTKERAKALDDIGFCWDAHEAVWSERFRELCQYKADFGNCMVPTNFPANAKLGTWVHHQRRQYKKFKDGKSCHITPQRIQALDQLGFVWSPRVRTGSLSASSTPRSLTPPSSISSTTFQDDRKRLAAPAIVSATSSCLSLPTAQEQQDVPQEQDAQEESQVDDEEDLQKPAKRQRSEV